MRELPSKQLLELLARLGLLTPAQVRSVARRVRKLAGDLPRFDLVWVDALAQSRLLTAYQAREINAGRGGQLAVGPYVVRDRLPSIGYAEIYLARASKQQRRFDIPESDRQGRKRSILGRWVTKPNDCCVLVARLDAAHESEIREQLARLKAASQSISSRHLRPLRDFGMSGDQVWMMAERASGVRASDWITENGRFPPLVVLHLARQMLVGLCELERLALPHGDLNLRNFALGRDGTAALLFPGVRAVLRPHEGFSMIDLSPECYESLAPERVLLGTPPTLASDLFACGCVWWQMLAGRPPITGGNALAKLKAAAESRIPDVRQLAPDAPPVLAEVIAACTSSSAENRPRSFAEVARLLGPAGESGAAMIARCLKAPERWLLPRPRRKRNRSRLAKHALEFTTAAACIVVTLAAWRLTARPASLNAGLAMPTRARRSPDGQKPREATPPPQRVVPASFIEPAANSADKSPGDVPPLRLPVGRVLRLASLDPVAGQLVLGATGLRPIVVVPREGLTIDQPDVRFVDLDFVAEDDGSSSPMIILRASTARFERCTFHGASEQSPRTVIAWESAATSTGDDWDASLDHLSLFNCVVHQAGATIERSRVGEATVECANVLIVASGSLIRLPLPAADAAVSVSLDHCTLRAAGPVVEAIEPSKAFQRLGRITVTAVDCVLAPAKERSLIELSMRDAESGSGTLRWTGKDSLLEVNAGLAASRDKTESLESMDESKINVTGLARSPLDFAGQHLDRPASSQLRRWLAPRQSLAPPGIAPGNLPENSVDLTSSGRNLSLR